MTNGRPVESESRSRSLTSERNQTKGLRGLKRRGEENMEENYDDSPNY